MEPAEGGGQVGRAAGSHKRHVETPWRWVPNEERRVSASAMTGVGTTGVEALVESELSPLQSEHQVQLPIAIDVRKRWGGRREAVPVGRWRRPGRWQQGGRWR